MTASDPLAPLKAWPQWIAVKLVPLSNSKTDKLPIDPTTGQVTPKASGGAHNPLIWRSYAEAAALAAGLGQGYTVGFVLSASDPFWCLDVDNALQADGTWSPLAQQVCQLLPGAVVEVSQSGRGLHLWGQGAPLPTHARKRTDLGLELYDSLRFIALGTGAQGDMTQPCAAVAALATAWFPPAAAAGEVPDTGARAEWRGPADDDELIRRALKSQSASAVFGGKASFGDLWDANVEVLPRAYPSSTGDLWDRSSADAALFQHLSFWTGCDQARMVRLARRSKLVRDKWEREDYLAGTVANACRQQRDVLQDKPSQVDIDHALHHPGALAPPVAGVLGVAAPQPAVGDVPADVRDAGVAQPHDSSGLPVATAVTGRTFLGAEDQLKLFAGCIYITELHRALVPGGHLLKPDSFRAHFGGYTFAMDAANERTTRNAWEAFTESQVLRAPRADGVCFQPSKPYGAIVRDAGRTRANTWWPVNTPRQVGDPGPFLEHLRRLLPNERDRAIVLAYMAACVQHVGVKFQWAPLIQGVEGNGKTFLSACVAEAIGNRYVHWPKASKIAKQFNGWMANNVFYAVEDIHTSDGNDVIEELKPMITGGRGIEIERKGIDQVSTEICGNFIFNTNHKAGIRKTRNDRRWCVLYTAQQAVDDLLRDGVTGEYMRRLYEWAKAGGFAIVTEYLHTYKIPDDMNPAGGCQRAPVTSSTDEAIRAGLGRVEQEVMEAIEQGLPGFSGGWISTVMLDRLLERLGGRVNGMSPYKRAELLAGLGYVKHPGLPDGRVVELVVPDGAKPRLYVQAGSQHLALTGAAAIGRAYAAAQGAMLGGRA